MTHTTRITLHSRSRSNVATEKMPDFEYPTLMISTADFVSANAVWNCQYFCGSDLKVRGVRDIFRVTESPEEIDGLLIEALVADVLDMEVA